MSPSERFEMRIDEDLLGRVDEWRAAQHDVPTRAEAVRRLLEAGLARSSGRSVSFSAGEKLLLSMMRDLYKHLSIKNAEIDPDFVIDSIVGGHYWAPKWELSGLLHDHEDDPRVVAFVVDVLDMWRFIEDACESLPKKERTRIEEEVGVTRFFGFDGNNETEYMGVAAFLVEKMGRFEHFGKRSRTNSHMPMVEGYRRMLAVFEPLRKDLGPGQDLSKEQVLEILRARRQR